MANERIKSISKSSNIPQWRIAVELGISEATLTRWLRVELTPDKEQQVLAAIKKISGGECT